MGNIKNYDFRRLDLKLSNSDYWDFYLADDYTTIGPSDYNSCLIIDFDFNNPNIFTSGAPTTISSLAAWTGATNTGYTLTTIGLTGIDNGLVTFTKDPTDPTNQALLAALTGSTLYIPSGDSRLHLNMVSGMTGEYIYPIDILTGTTGQYAKLSGGFYQGYYKIHGTNYRVLPDKYDNGFTAKFTLYKDDTTIYDGNTLNDKYPNNKGFFFYMGTRAENKFWDLFTGADTGCTSGCTVTSGCTDILSPWCTIPKENQIFIQGTVNTGDTISLYPDQTNKEYITNQFLIYGQAGPNNSNFYPCSTGPSGLGNQTAWSYDGKPVVIVTPKTVVTNTQNPFLIYGQAGPNNSNFYPCSTGPSGFGNQTAWSFSGFTKSIEFDNIDYKLDVVDNAVGFRIKDDGSIGYRLLTVTGQCSGGTYVNGQLTGGTYITGVTVQEAYSDAGLIPYQTWTDIVIRFTMPDYYNLNQIYSKKNKTGNLMFYINGKLKFVVKNFPEYVGKHLNDHMEKQIGVPFNISLGGGSQGLIETMTFDGIDASDLGLDIETNFAGSFIGGISDFKFFNCDLSYVDIQYL